jgi:hypothetical protein
MGTYPALIGNISRTLLGGWNQERFFGLTDNSGASGIRRG